MSRHRHTDGYGARSRLDAESDRLLERTCARLGVGTPFAQPVVKLGPNAEGGSESGSARRHGNRHGAVGDEILDKLGKARNRIRDKRVGASIVLSTNYKNWEEVEERIIFWNGVNDLLEEFNRSFDGTEMLATNYINHVVAHEIQTAQDRLTSVLENIEAGHKAARHDDVEPRPSYTDVDNAEEIANRQARIHHENQVRVRETEDLFRMLDEDDRLAREKQAHREPTRQGGGWDDVARHMTQSEDILTDEQEERERKSMEEMTRKFREKREAELDNPRSPNP